MSGKKSIRNTSTEESRAYWAFVDSVAKEVSKWPAWKQGGGRVRKEGTSVGRARASATARKKK